MNLSGSFDSSAFLCDSYIGYCWIRFERSSLTTSNLDLRRHIWLYTLTHHSEILILRSYFYCFRSLIHISLWRFLIRRREYCEVSGQRVSFVVWILPFFCSFLNFIGQRRLRAIGGHIR